MSWPRFINHRDTPVDLRSTTDLYGGAVEPMEFVDVDLTPQLVRYNGHYRWKQSVTYVEDASRFGFQLDWDDAVADDVKKFNLPRTKVETVIIDGFIQAETFGLVEAPWDGTYTFECRIEMAEYTSVVWNSTTINMWIQKFGAHPSTRVQFSESIQTFGSDSITVFTVSQSYVLTKGEQVMIYGAGNNDGNDDTVFGWDLSDTDNNDLQYRPYPGSGEPNTYLRVTADTTFQQTSSQAFLLHDAFAAVIHRITGSNCFYSEILGSTKTNARQYDTDGCYWSFAILKGLHLKGYTLDQKPFFISFNDLWKGADPEFNLGLGYEDLETTGESVIRIEKKSHFYGQG